MGGGSDPPPANTTSKTTTELPKWIQPYSRQLLRRGVARSQDKFVPYTGARVHDFVPAQNLSLSMIRGAAEGDYLSPETNPWLKKTYRAASDDVADAYRFGTAAQTDAAAARANAFGGSAYNERVALNERELGRSLENLAADIYGSNYQQERSRQMGAQDALWRIGESSRGIAQAQLDADYAEWLRSQEWPLRQLDILGSAIGQSMGRTGTTTTQQPYFAPQFNPYAAAAGLGLAGLGAYGGNQGWFGG